MAQQLGRYVRAARGVFSHNTERALRSDLGICANWCAERGERALLASAETVAAFVDAMAATRAPATVRRSKTDGEGRGEIVYLARDTVALVHTWLSRSGITAGRLFRIGAQVHHIFNALDNPCSYSFG